MFLLYDLDGLLIVEAVPILSGEISIVENAWSPPILVKLKLFYIPLKERVPQAKKI